MDKLHSRWRKLWKGIGSESSGGMIYRNLIERYSEPHRAYHNLEHIADCLLQLDSGRRLLTWPDEVELAVWFHDAIYDPRRSDNEEQSARLAENQLRAAAAGSDKVERIADLIGKTAHAHDNLEGDAAVLCDVDLTILGAEPLLFDRYDAAIRQEYDWVPEEAYRLGRKQVLERFLDRPRIYHTQYFFDRLEQQARVNLERAVRLYRS